MSLLDYLKRCDPPDTETYNAVAVKFEMNREIGELEERDAKQNLKLLTKKAMGKIYWKSPHFRGCTFSRLTNFEQICLFFILNFRLLFHRFTHV